MSKKVEIPIKKGLIIITIWACILLAMMITTFNLY